MTRRFENGVANEEQLRQILGEPSDTVVNKGIPIIDKHCAALIERSSFVLIASSDASGKLDISPKGDPAGFVQVLDEKTLAIPDRLGNRRADTFTNVLQNPHVALLFLAPGHRETLRVTGTAQIVRDEDLRRSMELNGKVPDLALVVSVEEAFFHCAKCVIRSGLWQAEKWPDLAGMPPLAEILIDHAELHADANELQKSVEESYSNRLY